MNFEELKINPWLCQALKSISITKPTPIQKYCLPEAFAGKDIIASAATGSGKTIAFALPILQELGLDPFGVFALVISPTRELCFQIAEQFRLLGNGIGLKVAVIVGGMDMLQQAVELAKKPHIVVCTPGRLHDHINSSANAIHFKRIKYLVLDEADRLLDDSFSANLKVILAQLPKNRQTFLLSATMTDSIKALRFKPNVEPFVYAVTEKY
jgi:ATP-dependent RNA helicase DDX49/DBP8